MPAAWEDEGEGMDLAGAGKAWLPRCCVIRRRVQTRWSSLKAASPADGGHDLRRGKIPDLLQLIPILGFRIRGAGRCGGGGDGTGSGWTRWRARGAAALGLVYF
jgi:hypothetical protein